MQEERIALSQKERDRLQVLHEVERKHLRQREAAQRLGLSERLLRRVKREGDRGVIHRLRGRPSNRKIPRAVEQRILAEVQRRYRDFGPTLQLIAQIDDATSRFGGRFVEHDSTEENLRTLEQWLRRYGRPVALYTDQGSVLAVNALPPLDEQLAGEPAQSQFGRALRELDIRWIAAQHLPELTPLPRGGGLGGKSFRPTASRTRRPNPKKNQIHSPSHSPVEEDTATWQEREHFYFALTGVVLDPASESY
jgi:DNA-binding Lrp family transcriptional regulator